MDAKGARGERLLTDERLKVAPELLGLPLASPRRRLAALVLDILILLIPTVAVAFGAAALSLRMSDPDGYRAVRALWIENAKDPVRQRVARKDLARLLVRIEAPGLPSDVRAAVEKGDLERAGDLLKDTDFTFALNIGESEEEINLQEGMVLVQIERLIPKTVRAACLFGLAALYFVLLTASRRGATLGKRLFGIRVVFLEGGRLPLWESFERFAGYLEIPASLGLSLVSLWRDPNRRLPHDRLAGTAVVRARRLPEAPTTPEELRESEADLLEAEDATPAPDTAPEPESVSRADIPAPPAQPGKETP